MLADFFSNYNLYQKFNLNDTQEDLEFSNVINFLHPYHFNDISFQYFCEREGESRTFRTQVDEFLRHFSNSDLSYYVNDDKLDYTFKCEAVCQNCRKHVISFLLRIYTTEKILKKNVRHRIGHLDKQSIEIPLDYKSGTYFIEKGGIYPQLKPSVSKEVSKYLDSRELNTFYFKGLKLINESHGIGAFSYFRRIVEVELKKIVEDISKLNSSDQNGINELLSKYKDVSETHTIYNNIFQFLPQSLKSLGENPIKLLYKISSEGIHSLSDEECLEKAKDLEMLLEFTIKKIKEENSEIKEMRERLKRLKN